MKRLTSGLTRRGLIGGLIASPAIAQAQTAWPSRTVRIIVPFTPGGSTDLLARLVASQLSHVFPARSFIVENRPGAGGSTAATQVARADADGHTLMMGHIGTLAFNPSLYTDLPYDPVRDFEPVALIASVPNILVTHPGIPARALMEFVAYAKANPGKLNFSSGGPGSAAHIAGAYLAYKAGFEAVHVPYRGTGPSVTDLVAGIVQFTLTGGPAVLPFAANGQLRALGIASLERAGFAPQLPTLSEAGLAGFETVQWYGVVAPARTPTAIVERLNREINAILDKPEFIDVLARDGAVALKRTQEQFRQLIAAEIPLWREVIRTANIVASG